MKKQLAPSILSADFLKLGEQIKLVESGGADIIHCDIMDGQFVPNITFGPMIVKAVNKITDLPLDVHLMIKNPDAIIKEFINAGADYITVHQEEVVHLHRTIQNIKSFGAKAGVAINPATPVDTLSCILDEIDLVLIMSVNPGFGGQSFISSTLQKVQKLAALREQHNYMYEIEIDGGMNEETIPLALHAGVDIFVAGSAVFNTPDITAASKMYKTILDSFGVKTV
ncbi:MAG: ribulose-phosphate 3-epimerase [Ignavibacteriales bacterium]|nr:ribulose-phosphate 3-epimerase [Ignavibacteriales bacterium]